MTGWVAFIMIMYSSKQTSLNHIKCDVFASFLVRMLHSVHISTLNCHNVWEMLHKIPFSWTDWLLLSQDTVSVHRPGFYAERFYKFCSTTVFRKSCCEFTNVHETFFFTLRFSENHWIAMLIYSGAEVKNVSTNKQQKQANKKETCKKTTVN